MKYVLLTVGALALFAPALAAQDKVIPPRLDLGPVEDLSIVTENGTHTFEVEIADSPKEQNRGLMYRNELAPNAGMLFEFDEPKIASIWMKNTAIPLDILFVRENGKILKIEHLAVPYSLRSASSETDVGAVLEIPGGRAQELGIAPGDEIQHEFFGNVETETDE